MWYSKLWSVSRANQGIKSLSTLLSVKFHLSHQSISELFVDLYNQPINSATIQSSIQTASKQSDETLRHIKTELLKLASIHLDETSKKTKVLVACSKQ